MDSSPTKKRKIDKTLKYASNIEDKISHVFENNRMHNRRQQVKKLVEILLCRYNVEPIITTLIMEEYLDFFDFYPITMKNYSYGLKMPVFNHLFTSPKIRGGFHSCLNKLLMHPRLDKIYFNDIDTFESCRHWVKKVVYKLLKVAYADPSWNKIVQGKSFEEFASMCELPRMIRCPLRFCHIVKFTRDFSCEKTFPSSNCNVWEKGKDKIDRTNLTSDSMQFEFRVFLFYIGCRLGASVRIGKNIVFH